MFVVTTKKKATKGVVTPTLRTTPIVKYTKIFIIKLHRLNNNIKLAKPKAGNQNAANRIKLSSPTHR